MNEYELKGEEYLGDAERALKRWTIFGIGRDAKYEDAAGAYEKAAAQFKASKNYGKAANAYIEAAKNLQMVNNELEATTNWKNAATQLVLTGDTDKAVECYMKAINHYIASDRFNSVARLYSDIGKLYEDKKILDKSIKFYNEALDSFELENNTSQARKMKIKVADVLAKDGKHSKAIDLYEEVVEKSTDERQKWGLKTLLEKASICHLVVGSEKDDMTEAAAAIAKYEDMSEIFYGSRENKLVQNLRKAYEDNNIEDFQNAIYEFESISKLDEFKISMLHIVLENLKKEHTPPIFDNDEKKNDPKKEPEDDFR